MRIKKRVSDAWNWARSRFSDRSAILLYHRVASRERDQFGLCVTPENFAQHIACVAESGTALPLMEFVAQNRRGELLPRSIAVTFDDGYLDVLHDALPVLERYHVPATIFIVTGNFGAAFWWDRLADLIVHSVELPDTIDLGPKQFPTSGVSRGNLLKRLYPTVRAMPPARRDELLEALAQQIGHTPGLAAERAMDIDELRSLARHPLITLGAHTVTHSQLSSLDATGQEAEIASSVQQLAAVIGQPVKTFSYPFGIRSRDYTDTTMAAARRAGLDHALAADLNIVNRAADDFAIPRLWIHDWDGRRFRRNLQRWL